MSLALRSLIAECGFVYRLSHKRTMTNDATLAPTTGSQSVDYCWRDLQIHNKKARQLFPKRRSWEEAPMVKSVGDIWVRVMINERDHLPLKAEWGPFYTKDPRWSIEGTRIVFPTGFVTLIGKSCPLLCRGQ